MSRLVVRPSRLDDFDDMMELADLSGPGLFRATGCAATGQVSADH